VADSTTASKPNKPYPEFPLYAHATKRWAKKVKGKTWFYGPWNDWQGALEFFQYAIHYHQQGIAAPPRDVQALTVSVLVNTFLERQESRVQSGELSKRSWDDYKQVSTIMVDQFGRYTAVDHLTPNDFSKLRTKLAAKWSLKTLDNVIGRIKVICNYAHKSGLIEYPIRMGVAFAKPTKSSLKKEKLSKPAKVFSIDELQTLYHAANKQMRCFMLLALNGGMGNGDIGQLESKHLQDGWVKFPRPKTQVDRAFPLWPETLKAIEQCRQTEYESPLVFITKYGQSWYKEGSDNPITKEFAKLCKECKLQQEHRGFYALRHTFRTVADGCRDQVAINHAMGHSDGSMGATYREWIEPERLQAVVDHVYQWVKPMFTKPAKLKAGAK
jgi:integrase